MATFLEICKSVNTLSGVQGVVNDTTNTTGIQAVIVESVRQAWLFIQDYRKNWTFMIDRVNFNTVVGQEIYTPTEVFANELTEDLGVYIKDKVFCEHKNVPYLTIDDYPYIDNTIEGDIKWFTVEPSSNNLYLSLPKEVCEIDLYYVRDSQILTASLDVPNLPERYHPLILNKSLELFNNTLGNYEAEAKAAHQADIMMGALMRQYITQKRVNLFGGLA